MRAPIASRTTPRDATSLVGATLVLLLAACGDDPAARRDATSEAEPAPARRPNVLVITLDTLRADHLGLYGYARDTSPNLDAFARESVVFENAYSNSSFTPPSHASILTGLFPSEHGLMHWSQTLCEVPTAAELFASVGYRTLAISPLRTLFVLGLSRGFETVLQPPHREGDGLIYLADAETINAEVLPLLVGRDDERPFFAWLHYYDAHRVFGRQGPQWAQRYDDSHDPGVGSTELWYQLRPEPYKGKLAQSALSAEDVDFMIDRYDGGLAYLDARLGELFDALDASGVLDETLVVVTADHGEVFAEHDEEWFSHDPHLFDENVHVPLVVRVPHGGHAGLRVDDPVQGVDLLPTMLDLAGVTGAAYEPSGLSLRPTLEGRSLQRLALFADRMGADLSGRADRTPEQVLAERDRKRMVRTATHKLIVNEDRRTVSLFANGDEHTNLWDKDDPQSQRMHALYRSLVEALDDCAAGSGEVDPEMDAFLRQLGYVGAAGVDDLQAEHDEHPAGSGGH